MDNFDLKKYLSENKLNEADGKTQTTIEWLVEQLEPNIMWTEKARELVEQAKKMEKDQMKKMYEHAMWALADTGHGEGFEEYWSKNFK